MTVVEWPTCAVFWGSHGCCLPRLHEGDCLCDCAFGENAYYEDDDGTWNVGAPPYYGDGRTFFYGEDAVLRGLPLLV